MVRTLLIRGMAAGLLAGLLVFAVARVLGEPQVAAAIAFESAADEAKAQADAVRGLPAPPPEPELVSRPVQAGPGLLTAVAVYAAALGGLFALVFAAVHGRLAAVSPRATAALLAGAGFVAVYLVPGLKYPANPPAIGLPETIGHRTALFFLMLVVSVAAMVAASMLRARLLRRFGAWNATLTAVAAYLAAVAVAGAVLPPVNEVPDAFPAALLWQFRIAAAAMQATLWGTLGLAFGVLADRALFPRRASGTPEPLRP